MGPARGRGRGRGNRMPPPPPLMARKNMMPPLRSPPLMPPRMRPPPPPGMRGPPFAPPHPPHPPRLPPPPGFRGIPPRLPPGPLPPPLSPRRFPPRPMFPGPHGPPLLPPPPPPGPPMMDGPHARLRRPPGPPLPFMPFGPMNPMMKKKWNAKKQIISQPAVKKLRKAKNPWITEDILILIEQRKKAYNSKTAEGRKKFLALKNEVTKRSRKAKELWMEQQKVKEGGEKKTEEGENVTANGSSTEKTDNETGAAVKEEGKDGDVTEASTDGTDISNVEPIVKDNCYCVTCERGFKTEEEFATHCAGHVTCGVDGCQLSADPKVIDKHYNMQHKTGLFNRLALEPADVQKWIEERKRRFPTKKNVQENKERLEEMEKRGERLHKENGRFGKRKGGNQTDDQPAKIRKVEPNKPKQKRMKNVLKDESEREFSWRGDLPHFAGTALYPQAEDEMNEDEEEDPSNAQNKMENNDFTDEEWEGDTSLDQINTANKASLPNALLSISGYESASESEAEADVSVTKPIEPVIKPKEAVEPVIAVTERVLPVTKSAGSVTKSMEAVAKSVESVPNHVVSVTEPVAQSVVSVTKSVESDTEHVKAVTETDDQSENCEIVKFNFTIETNDDDDDEPPEEVKIRKTSDPSFAEKVTEKVEVTAVLNGVDKGAVLTNGNSEHKGVMSNGKLEYSDDKPVENSKPVKNPRNPEMKPVTRTTTISRRRATLLEKLLEPDIRHERNVILQCVRYAVENNFFERHMKN